MKVANNNTKAEARLAEIFETIIGLTQSRVTNNTPEKKDRLEEIDKREDRKSVV